MNFGSLKKSYQLSILASLFSCFLPDSATSEGRRVLLCGILCKELSCNLCWLLLYHWLRLIKKILPFLVYGHLLWILALQQESSLFVRFYFLLPLSGFAKLDGDGSCWACPENKWIGVSWFRTVFPVGNILMYPTCWNCVVELPAQVGHSNYS